MSVSNASNTASPQATTLADLAAQYFIEEDHSVEGALGDAIDQLLVEEDVETLTMASLLLLKRDPDAEEDFWGFAKERAEMFLTEAGEVSTLFAIPILRPDFVKTFSLTQIIEALVKHGLVCESAQINFFPVPVDGGKLLTIDPASLFRLHGLIGVNNKAVLDMVGQQASGEGSIPYLCLIGTITVPAQLHGPCLAWELDTEEYLQRIRQWNALADEEVRRLHPPVHALGIPGRFVFAVREGATEFQDIVLHEFIEKAMVASRSKQVLARLADGSMTDSVILDLYDDQQSYGFIQIPWRVLGLTRSEVIEVVFDALRGAGALGIMFEKAGDAWFEGGVVH